ncbi:MAG: hypothetical protein ACI4EH_09985 [Oliverpabstia sp.]
MEGVHLLYLGGATVGLYQNGGYDEQRKKMAQVISEIIQEKVVYKRVPTCAYQIGSFTISKDGVLSWPEDTDAKTVKGVVTGLQMMGFTAETGGRGYTCQP